MKILFGKHYGKDIGELDSGYLLWIIEHYEKADWIIITACKDELSQRLKLDWQPKSDHVLDLETSLDLSTKQVSKLLKQIALLEKCLIMSTCFGATKVNVDGYLQNPKLLEQNLQFIRDANQ